MSLASITVFSGLDPTRSNGLMWYGCPERLSSPSPTPTGCCPMLMEEFQNVLAPYRLGQSPRPRDPGGQGSSYLIYQVKIIMQSFYPLMLNTPSAPAPR